jgi:hypothetical protein
MKPIIALLALSAPLAWANPLPKQPAPQTQEQSQNQNQGQNQVQYQNAQGGQAGSNQWADASRMYVFPGVALGGPSLPAGLCPMNDRVAWGVAWNFFWIDTSTVRTDMQCLEAMLSVMRMTAPKPVLLPPLKKGECLHPPKKPKMVCKTVT